MDAALHHLAPVENKNAVGIPDGLQTMSDYDRGAALEKAFQSRLDGKIFGRINTGGRLVQHRIPALNRIQIAQDRVLRRIETIAPHPLDFTDPHGNPRQFRRLFIKIYK